MSHSNSLFTLALLLLNVGCPHAASPMRRAVSVNADGNAKWEQADSHQSLSELASMLPGDKGGLTQSLLMLAKEGGPHDELLKIVRDVKAEIPKWHTSATATLEKAIDAVHQCATKMQGDLEQSQAKKSECSAQSTSHTTHRREESTRFTTNEHWKAQTAEKKEVMDTECKIFSDVKAEARAATAKYGGGDEGSYLESVCEEFSTGLLPRIKDAKEKCTTAEAEHETASGKYEAATTAWKVQVEASNTVQTELDMTCCQHALATKDTCDSYGTCYEDKVAEYNSVKKMIEAEEKVNKVEWRVYSRIECLLPVLGTDDAAKIEECRAQEHSTAHLDIDYPEVPDKGSCAIEAAYPGTDAYYNAHYASLPDNAKGEPVATCVGMDMGASEVTTAVAHHVAQSAPDYCAAQCQAAGFCCNDWKKGSNQMISCAQACMMRSTGSKTSEMTAANNGICKRHGQSGCSLTVAGVSYGFCSSCSDLTSSSKCSWGVSSPEACDFGAALSPPGAP